MKDYDNAIIKFRQNLKYSLMPVLSWDFYSQNYDAINKAEDDINTLLNFATKHSWILENDLLNQKLKMDKNVIIVTDLKLNIVFATKNMWDMSQYHPQEILGKNPKMFQGDKTSKIPLKIISKAVKENKPFEVTLINYRKDGTTYNCKIEGKPIFNKKGSLVNFIAFEKEVA